MTVDDLSGEWVTKLIDHLKNEDFFEVKKFNTSHFALNKVTKNKEGSLIANGVLKIKETSNEIHFQFKSTFSNGNLSINGVATFDRTKFSIKYNSKNFFKNIGDKMIDDMVTIEFSIITKK